MDMEKDILREETEIIESHEEAVKNTFAELSELLEEKSYQKLGAELAEMNPIDTAEFLQELPHEKLPVVFRLLKKDLAADVFAELDRDFQEQVITILSDRELSLIVEDLFSDDAADMLEEMPSSIVRRIRKNMTPETAERINRLLAYPDDSAGSIMTSEYVQLRKNMTVSQAVDYIRRTSVDKETVYNAYVVDAANVLEGTVSFKDLLFARHDAAIEEIMEANVIYAMTLDDRETAAGIISKYDLLALPVVDGEKRLVGIVTVDDALDVLEDEATEDIEKMAAIVPTDKPYTRTNVFETWKKRIPWLLLLMVTATFTSTIVSRMEARIDGLDITLALSLSAFIPMLMDTGGNAGSQTSVTVIRALSLGEVEVRDIFSILWKELRVALLCGVTVLAACFVKTWIVDCRFAVSPQYLLIAATVSATIFCTVIIANVVGAILPMLAKLVRLDPAVMASPFITTIVDTLTLLIYFALIIGVLVPQLQTL